MASDEMKAVMSQETMHGSTTESGSGHHHGFEKWLRPEATVTKKYG